VQTDGRRALSGGPAGNGSQCPVLPLPLSARIPNHRLAACHREYAGLFEAVKRIPLRDVVHCFPFILWDSERSKHISVAEFRAQQALGR
jgi:hypothetical protein